MLHLHLLWECGDAAWEGSAGLVLLHPVPLDQPHSPEGLVCAGTARDPLAPSTSTCQFFLSPLSVASKFFPAPKEGTWQLQPGSGCGQTRGSSLVRKGSTCWIMPVPFQQTRSLHKSCHGQKWCEGAAPAWPSAPARLPHGTWPHARPRHTIDSEDGFLEIRAHQTPSCWGESEAQAEGARTTTALEQFAPSAFVLI